jgi:hypothetical protein
MGCTSALKADSTVYQDDPKNGRCQADSDLAENSAAAQNNFAFLDHLHHFGRPAAMAFFKIIHAAGEWL